MNNSLLFRLASDPVARLWGGVGDLIIPADLVEDEPATYPGGGELVNIPDLDQIINGSATRIDVVVSGVSAATLAIAMGEASVVKGALINIGFVYFDSDWQVTEVEWISTLRADTLTIDSQPNDNGRLRSITLSIGTDFTDRSKAPVAYFTDADQRRRSADDAIFDCVAGLETGTSRIFSPTDASG